jgi:hypothetical protein
MTNSDEQPIKMNGKNNKTIQFYNTQGVKKVFDIHRYSETGTLYYMRKNHVAAT